MNDLVVTTSGPAFIRDFHRNGFLNIIVPMRSLIPVVALVTVFFFACKKAEPEQCWKCITTSVAADLFDSSRNTYSRQEMLCGKTEQEIANYEQSNRYPGMSNGSNGSSITVGTGGNTYSATIGQPYGAFYNSSYLISASCTCTKVE
jgi:hypothetical protein